MQMASDYISPISGKRQSIGVYLAILGIVLTPALALAQQTRQYTEYPCEGHYMMNWGTGGYGMAWEPLFMILVLVLIIVLTVLLVRWLSGPSHPGLPSHHLPPSRTPLDILKERYARGEITKEQFEEIRRVLGD